jgi:hypothetical protein
VNRSTSAVIALALTIATVLPAATQQAPSTPQGLPSDICAGCFAYLEFPPSLEPESYAMRGQETEPPTSFPAAGEPNDRLREQKAGLLAASK